jgi:hypothetical protein
MTQDKIDYWTKFSFDKMRKEGAVMPRIITKILEMEEFKNSDVSEEELRQSIKERFSRERQAIIGKAKEKLKKLEEGNADLSD